MRALVSLILFAALGFPPQTSEPMQLSGQEHCDAQTVALTPGQTFAKSYRFSDPFGSYQICDGNYITFAGGTINWGENPAVWNNQELLVGVRDPDNGRLWATHTFKQPSVYQVQAKVQAACDKSGQHYLQVACGATTVSVYDSIPVRSATVPTLTGGQSGQGTLTLQTPAGGNDAMVYLRSSNPTLATVDPKVYVTKLAKQAPFNIQTNHVLAPTSVTISLDAGGKITPVVLNLIP